MLNISVNKQSFRETFYNLKGGRKQVIQLFAALNMGLKYKKEEYFLGDLKQILRTFKIYIINFLKLFKKLE